MELFGLTIMKTAKLESLKEKYELRLRERNYQINSLKSQMYAWYAQMREMRKNINN